MSRHLNYLITIHLDFRKPLLYYNAIILTIPVFIPKTEIGIIFLAISPVVDVSISVFGFIKGFDK